MGSGVTPDQLGSLFQYADAVIVGSWIKTGGLWSNAVDAQRCREMVKARG
ncbi:MAG: BtpA/SgcQ family protein [Phycisphaerales bacterium]